MSKRLRRIGILCAMIVWMLLMSGCTTGSSVEELFTLPQLPEDYAALADQLQEMIDAGYEYITPDEGPNVESIKMTDLDGDGTKEAVVLMRYRGSKKPLKVYIFKSTGNGYENLCTIENDGERIGSIYFEDLTGDGIAELVIGWRIGSDVQRVEVFRIGRECISLMATEYARFAIQELDGDTVPSLLVIQVNEEGVPVAKFYRWETDVMRLSQKCQLSNTLTNLNRGSIVSGTLINGTPAVFITGVDEQNVAVTDVLVYRGSFGLTNIARDTDTKGSGISVVYRELIPQDINGDGITEIPYPLTNRYGDALSLTRDTLVDWVQLSRSGERKRVAQTYHCQNEGWYFSLPSEWWDSVFATNTDSANRENRVVLSVDGENVAAIYSITAENREARAQIGGRFIILRLPNVIYAGELYENALLHGADETMLRDSFSMIVDAWSAS